MKRVLTISVLVMVLCLRMNAQLGAISGQLSYQQYYRDYRFEGGLSKVLIRTPVLDLRTRGNILSRRFISYSLFSSIRANYISTSSDDFSYSGNQYSWNRYNLSLRFFPYAPVKLTLAARENAYDITSKTEFSTDYSANRQQEQRADLAVYQVPWLPTLSLAFVRNRSYSITGYPYEIVNQTLTFGANGATDTAGAYNLTATMADLRDRISGWYDRFLTMQFSASRNLSEGHGINLGADYQQYSGASILGFSIQYSGLAARGLRLTTSLGASNTLTSKSQARSLSLSQAGSIRINDHFRLGLGASGYFSKTVIAIGGGGATGTYRSFATSGNVQHQRSVSGIAIQNVVSVGYSEQKYADRFYSMNVAWSNNLSRSFGTMVLNGSYNFSYVKVRSSSSYDVANNEAGLRFGGMLTRVIQTQTDFRYRDSRYPGYDSRYRDQKTYFFTQRFDGTFDYYIRFTLALSGSANWYVAGLTGNTYGWHFSFMSPSFFIRRLSIGYTYSRTFDPYYRREIPEHNGSLAYTWRSLSVTGRYRHTTFPIQSREYQFVVARTF